MNQIVNIVHEGVMAMLFHDVSDGIAASLEIFGSEMISEQHRSVQKCVFVM